MNTKKLITELEKIYTLVDDLEKDLYMAGKKDDDFTKKVVEFVDAVDDELSFLEVLEKEEGREAARANRLKRIEHRK